MIMGLSTNEAEQVIAYAGRVTDELPSRKLALKSVDRPLFIEAQSRLQLSTDVSLP